MLSDEKLIEVYALNCDCEGTRVMLNGLRAVAEAAVKDAVGGEVVEDFDDQMDAAVKDRYHLGETKGFKPFPCAVYAGTGTQELFRGSRSTCLHVARILTGAFLDGGFVASQYTRPQASATVPEKKTGPIARTLEGYGYVNGWNDCIDAILAKQNA